MNTVPPTVIVLDDDDAVRRALTLLLKAAGQHVKSYASAQVFFASGPPAQPGCLIADAHLPGLCALALLSELKARRATIPVIFTSSYGDVRMAVEAMKCGAFDFLETPFRDQTLLDRVDAALELTSLNLRQTEERQRLARCLGSLTARERKVLLLVTGGASNRSMARDLGVVQRTVEVHRSRVMAKMGARSLAQLVQMMAQFDTADELAERPAPRRGAPPVEERAAAALRGRELPELVWP
jgi:FixJ family two-component response regulator